MYWYVLVCTGIPLTGVDTGFRGSHRDAAMLPPSAVHASMEDRDSHPCPEDEDFFECRPDAADMEEAIGKFMEGMEKQERTGYLFGGEANAGVAFQIGQLRYIPILCQYIPVRTETYCVVRVCTDSDMYLYLFFRVGEGTVPLAIVIYIDGSFVKHKIPVKPIYVSVRNLSSTVSGKACAWRVLGMMPSLKKSATLDQTDTWRKERSLRQCLAVDSLL